MPAGDVPLTALRGRIRGAGPALFWRLPPASIRGHALRRFSLRGGRF